MSRYVLGAQIRVARFVHLTKFSSFHNASIWDNWPFRGNEWESLWWLSAQPLKLPAPLATEYISLMRLPLTDSNSDSGKNRQKWRDASLCLCFILPNSQYGNFLCCFSTFDVLRIFFQTFFKCLTELAGTIRLFVHMYRFFLSLFYVDNPFSSLS